MMPTPGSSGWVPHNGIAAPPPPPRRARKRVRLLVLALVPVLVVGGAVAAAALLIPPPTTPGEASASPGPIASRSEPTTTTTTPTPTPSTRPAPNTRVVKAKDGKSELTVPKHWRKAKKTKGLKRTALNIGNTARRQFVIVLTADKRNFADFGEFVALVRNSARDNLKKLQVKNKRKFTVNGMPAVRWHLAGNSEGMRFVYWDTAVRGQKAFYEVIGFTTPSHAAQAGPEIRRVIDSFKETAIDI
ncbi:MAG: hypothetical protein GEU97_13975 [Actinophytocola sp.]|nr:hypothetical protein [Actinophytocola sp.]